MHRRSRKPRGFTFVELAVVVAIIVTLGLLAWTSVGRLRPRARLADASSELAAMVHGARQLALTSGHDVVVMVFPQYAGPESTGRIVVYEDGDFSLLNPSAAPNFESYDPNVLAHADRSDIVATLDLPRSIVIGPSTGAGPGTALSAPLDGIPIDVDCSFCGALSDRRGAIRFDPRGRAFFHDRNGPSLANQRGGSLSLASPEMQGQRTLIVTSGTGSVSLRNQGG
jgi:prepilin-type N-terminal cleavage/methylation domain-containing protein